MCRTNHRNRAGVLERRASPALLLLWIAACSAPGGPATEAADAGGEGDGAGVPVHGSLWTRLRGRRTNDAEDLDLYTTLNLDVGDEKRHPYTAHVGGRLWWDVGGSGSIFSGLEDTHDGDLTGKLYDAYVDAHEVDSLEVLRLGRQQLWETPEFVVFDGVRVETEALGPGIELGAYGGLPTHFYESSSSGDLVAGVFGRARPWKGGRVRLDWMHLEDEYRLGSYDNDLLGVNVWQTLGKQLTLEGEYTRLEERDRDARLTANYVDRASDLSLQVSFYRLLEEQRDFALAADPFFASLQELSPYSQVGLLASKAVTESLDLDVGVDVRRLDDSSDEAEFNHEFEHYFANASFSDLGRDDLSLTLTADYWEDDQQDVSTWGADLTHQIDAELRGSLGSYYSLYKYDLFLDSERDDVRTYYLKLRWERSKALRWDAAIEYEDDDLEEYTTMRLGARWTF